MGRPKKDKFEDLSADFKDSVASMSEVEIRTRISNVALNQVALLNAKENDLDLAEKQEAAKFAGEVYREGSKANKLMIEFCKRVLEDQGKASGEFASE